MKPSPPRGAKPWNATRHETLPYKKSKVQEDPIIWMLLTLPLALRPLASIRRADIVSLHDAWVQDYAPVTVLRLLAVLTHVFNVARKEWGMESLSNPIEVVQACGNSVRQMQDDGRFVGSAALDHSAGSRDGHAARGDCGGGAEWIST